jgi:dephospho-CoA kinase
MKKIILIVGLPRSGKTLAADIIKRRFKADVLHSGDIVRDEVKRRGMKYTPQSDALVAHWFNTGGREKILTKKVWDKVKKSKKDLIVIEGFRSPKNLQYLKLYYKRKPVVIFLNSSFKARAKRESEKKRFGESETLEYLRFRDRLEKAHGVMRLVKKADYTINNSKFTKKQLEDEIVNVVKKSQKLKYLN